MPSKRLINDLVLFSSQDPRALVDWLCDRYGLSAVLQSVADYGEGGSTQAAPSKRAYTKRGGKKGGAKKGGKKNAAGKQSRKGSGKQTAAGD